jgi:hypothetical protein
VKLEPINYFIARFSLSPERKTDDLQFFGGNTFNHNPVGLAVISQAQA